MHITPYDPIRHYRPVAALWARALGGTYPVTERVLFPRIVGRNTLEPGDGVTAWEGARLVGFGIVEVERAALPPAPSASVQALLVHPDYQRRGLGTALLAQLEARARAAGQTELRLAGGH